MKDTHEIKGVQVFAVGEWNGDKYTMSDLEDMVKAFNETKEKVRPYLKLGHSSNQKLLAADGLPAAGWIESLYISGQKLCADFSGIPKKIFNLIEQKAYRKVSAEIYVGVKILERQYKHMLGAVALLGAEIPGVMCLDDIIALYSLKDCEQIKTYKETIGEPQLRVYAFEEETKGAVMPTEKELAQELELKNLKEQLASKENESKKFKSELEAKEAEAKAEKEKNEKLAADLKAEQEKLFHAEIDKEVQGMLTEGLITIGMKPFVKELIGVEKKEYSLKVGEADKKFSKSELFKEIAKLFSNKEDVNLDEETVEGERKDFAKDDKEMDEKIKKFMKENNCDYKAAYKALAKK